MQRMRPSKYILASLILILALFCIVADGLCQNRHGTNAVTQRGLFPLGYASTNLVLETEKVHIVRRPPSAVDTIRRYTIRNKSFAGRFQMGTIICQNCTDWPDGVSCSINVDGEPATPVPRQDRLVDQGSVVRIEPLVEDYLQACLKYPQGEVCTQKWALLELDFDQGQQRTVTLTFEDNETNVRDHLFLYSEKFWSNQTLGNIEFRLQVVAGLYAPVLHMPELHAGKSETITDSEGIRTWTLRNPQRRTSDPILTAHIIGQPDVLFWRILNYRPLKAPYQYAILLPFQSLNPDHARVVQERLRQRLVGNMGTVVQRQTPLPLRNTSIDGAYTVANLPTGQMVQIRTISDNWWWYEVQTPDGKRGYVPANQVRYSMKPSTKSEPGHLARKSKSPAAITLRADPAKRQAGKVATQGGDLWIRSGPGRKYATLARLANGEDVIIHGRSADDKWYRLQLSTDIHGYAAAAYIRPRFPVFPITGTIETKGGNLRIRSGPGMHRPIVTERANESQLRILGLSADGKWYHVAWTGGGSGYAFKRFVRPMQKSNGR